MCANLMQHAADKVTSVQRYISYSFRELNTTFKVKVQLLLLLVQVIYLVVAESTFFLFLGYGP